MPRKHPQPEEKKGSDPARERERREKRKAKRMAKSSGNYSGGLLTDEEITLLRQTLEDTKKALTQKPDDKRLQGHRRNLQSELDAHTRSLEKRVNPL